MLTVVQSGIMTAAADGMRLHPDLVGTPFMPPHYKAAVQRSCVVVLVVVVPCLLAWPECVMGDLQSPGHDL